MQDPATFPLGDTLGNGAYRATEELIEGGSQLLYLGESCSASRDPVLITVIYGPEGIALDELKHSLALPRPGTLELVLVSGFDIRGTNATRRTYQEQHFGLVEKLPAGEWLTRLTKEPLPPSVAVELGLSVGHLLARSAEQGNLIVGVRPEYLWAERREDGAIRVTGLSDRYRLFLAHTGGACSVPALLLRRSYLPPELHRDRKDRGSLQSLVFSLSMMVTEWTTGHYPRGGLSALAETTQIPPRLAHLLKLGLQAEPANRPSLAAFLAALEALGPEDLAS